jgi:hypothetical protein
MGNLHLCRPLQNLEWPKVTWWTLMSKIFLMNAVRKQFGEFAEGLDNKCRDHNCSATIM